jgi:hypothetical protein
MVTGRLTVVGLLAMGALASCSTASVQAPASPPAAAVTSPLATSLTSADGTTWAVLPVGGTGDNRFWELLARPVGGQQWSLVTPPGVASNGGLVAAAPAVGSQLTVAIRPSQGLRFSPLASTSDGGTNWGTGLVDSAVAAAPDALAAGGASMLALLTDGTIERGTAIGTGWTTLVAPGALATSPAARHCQVTALSGVTFAPSGTPLAAASCASPGVAGIFVRTSGGWAVASLALPASLNGEQVRVLRLTETSNENAAKASTKSGTKAGAQPGSTPGPATGGWDVALLQAGAGGHASLLAAWSADGTRWAVSAPLPAGLGQPLASGTGAGGTVWLLLPGGRAATVAGPGTPWRTLIALPPATAVLAAGSGGALDAITVSGAKLTFFRLGQAGQWGRAQVLTVPLQLGSSS